MAPAFAAAAELEPHELLLKVDTEAQRAFVVASNQSRRRYFFRGGREIARRRRRDGSARDLLFRHKTGSFRLFDSGQITYI